MLFYTHLLLGVLFFLIFKQFFSGSQEIAFLLLVLLGSILPDIDESKSKINQWFGAGGKIASLFSQHRGIFHSLIFTVFLFLLISFLTQTYYAYALALGYLSHLIGDALTPMGVQIFYPFSKFKLSGPIKVGGLGEMFILLLLLAILIKLLFF